MGGPLRERGTMGGAVELEEEGVVRPKTVGGGVMVTAEAMRGNGTALDEEGMRRKTGIGVASRDTETRERGTMSAVPAREGSMREYFLPSPSPLHTRSGSSSVADRVFLPSVL